MANEQQRPMFKPGDICHFELPVKNVERAKAFYGKVFGWTFQDLPEMSYTMFQTQGKTVGGGFITQDAQQPQKVTNYLLVESVDKASARVKELGGKLLNQKIEVPGHGVMQLFEDPEGNLLSLWEPSAMK